MSAGIGAGDEAARDVAVAAGAGAVAGAGDEAARGEAWAEAAGAPGRVLTPAQIHDMMGVAEERAAQMIQMVKANGLPDDQMAFMVRTATAKGTTPDKILAVMRTFGASDERAIGVMRTSGVLGDEEADAFLTGVRARAAAASGTGAVSDAEAAAAVRRKLWMGRLKKAAIILFWLAVWEVADRLIDNRLVLAGPVRTLQALGEQVMKPNFWMISLASTARIAAGFLMSFTAGVGLALVAYRVRIVREFVDPIISLLRTLPIVSFIIMLLIWVGPQNLTMFLAFFIVLPLIYTNVLSGFESVDPQMLEMARVFRLSPWRTFMYVYRPAVMPFLASSCKISLGMSWKSGIMAEVLAMPEPSIGKQMNTARTFLDTPDLFAWTVVVMLLSLAFEQLFMQLVKLAARPWGGPLGAASSSVGAAGRTAAADAGESASSDLRIEGVSKSFGDLHVLRGVEVGLRAGGIYCLMAPSGSGKTTLFKVLLGLDRADAGAVLGVEPGQIATMFQEERLCEALTPVENVLLACPRGTRRVDIRLMLGKILPDDCLDRPVSQLSGGMRRRVSLARAVAHPSEMLLLDEPFSGLDTVTKGRVIDFLLSEQRGRTMLVSTHAEGDVALLGGEKIELDRVQRVA